MTRAVPVTPAVSAGIDVSAATLDVHLHPLAKAMRFANDEAGINDLCRHLKDHKAEACVFEVTGHYSRALHKGLHAAGLPAIPVNPRQASFFIKSHSPSHKTDRTDAAALAAMALALPLRVVPPPTPVQQELHELVSTRTQLIRDRVAVSLRHEVMTAPVVRASLEALLATLEEQIRVIDRAIGGLVEADPDLSAKAELIESIPGIGRQCARAIMAYMPELGKLTGKQAAALAGVAPKTRDSGVFKGKRAIHGGRTELRNILYMAALSAMRCNPVIKAWLAANNMPGKPHKVARIATVRKLLVTLNAMIKNNTAWKHTA